ncbi:Gfo/Idh/MocA family protein [Falsibacillus albus]|uniref:Gfo/Idh/MocA family oxidoreductase n=1 Tax=Falsibacillus albus TaxID=2478915 RepID=A0A3L7JTI4_9BACI|nr:Gfo/Idh/MocA family oxidoreductase [Falsibacillus albus]RLQ94026.1 gfo/Idh/MocA family oxidoreductase [Falsibacillus albus]
MKLIQVGLGAHGKWVGSQFVIPSTDFEYAGLVDADPKCLKEAAELLEVPKDLLYTEYHKGFKDLQADAVLIEAASHVHYEICKEALNNNLHVLIEKPFTLHINEALELVELAAQKNMKIMVNQNYRCNSNVLTLKKAIQDGNLGQPLFVNSQFYYHHVGKPYQREMKDYMLLEMAVHHIDMMRFLFECNVASVQGKTWNSPESGYQGDPNVHAVYEMETGIPIFYLGSLLSKGNETPWEGIWRIQCQEGSIHLDDLGKGYGVYLVDSSHTLSKVQNFVPDFADIHGILSEFADCIRKNRDPRTSGRDNLHTLAAIMATSASSAEGKAVHPSDFLKA